MIRVSALATRFARSGYASLEIDQPLSVGRDDTETFGKVLDRTANGKYGQCDVMQFTKPHTFPQLSTPP